MQAIKVSEYICKRLLYNGYKHVFGLTGGGIARMFDSATTVGLKPVYTLHEQGGALAAVAYSMLTSGKGLCFVTTGPGGTNAITGLLGAYQDSTPVLFISGQARANQMAYNRGIRQGAVQDFPILDAVDCMCNYSSIILDASSTPTIMETTTRRMNNGRPGPGWIDIPVDVQWGNITDAEPETILPTYNYERGTIPDIDELECAIERSERPLILAGYGIRLADYGHLLERLVRNNHIPVVTTWNTMDMLDSDIPEYLGVVGTMGGRRGANKAMCECDLLIAIGSRLPVTVTGNLEKPFTDNTTVVMVDIDGNEHRYRDSIVDIHVYCDLRDFMLTIDDKLRPTTQEWRNQVQQYKLLNSVYNDHKPNSEYVNPYIWADYMSTIMDMSDTVVIDGGGSILSVAYNALNLRGQRAINCSGMACMGTGIPMGIGASVATGNRAIVMCGDGSFMLNVQELATIAGYNLPVKIFVMNNRGYLAIRNTQDMYYGNRHCGSSQGGGLHLPDLVRIVDSYDIQVEVADNNYDMEAPIRRTMECDGPAACILNIDPEQTIVPTPAVGYNSDGTTYQLPLSVMTSSTIPVPDGKEYER